VNRPEVNRPEVNGETHRLDVELVSRGLARSRGQARDLVKAGSVFLDGAVAQKVSTAVRFDQRLELAAGVEGWVSRAAYKLVAALEAFGPGGLSVADKRCIDVGAATGGFTQVLLRQGAREVVAVDVGHGQLAQEIAGDPRVIERSGVNVRDVRAGDLGGPAALLVADLSFISLRLVLPVLRDLVEPTGDLVLLVKPQFEVGREHLGKGGIVRSVNSRAGVIEKVVAAAETAGLTAKALCASPIRGATGNAEYLLWLTPRPEPGLSTGQVAELAATLSTEAPA
jgi:23S rRNA (cytidine1920-2'-O)/16S rRNA (cytidine1409-2'-O)-methyltransferase